jgi:hypothetical protein
VTIAGDISREEWLDCCRLCIEPKNVNDVSANIVTGDITCNCVDGESISLVREWVFLDIVEGHGNGVMPFLYQEVLMREYKRYKLKSMQPKKTHFLYHVIGDLDVDYPAPGERVVIDGAVKAVDDFQFVCLLPYRQGVELKLHVKRG